MAFALTSQASDITKWVAGTNTTDAVTLATVNAGDFIWVVATCDSGTLPTITVADPTNGSYTAKLQVDKTGDQVAQQFYFKNSAAATNLVITVTLSVARPWFAMYAAAWSGCDTAVGFDVQAGQVQTPLAPGTDVVDTTSATTTQADLLLGSLLVYAMTPPSSIAAGTSPAGQVEDSNLSPGVINAVKWELEHLIQGAAGSAHLTASTTDNTSVANSLSMMMAVKPFVAGGTYIPYRSIYPSILAQ